MVFAAAFALIATLTKTARADGWINRDLYATRVYKTTLWLDAGKTHVFQTTLSSGDTVMHLWHPTTKSQKAANDDFPGLGWNSRIETAITTGSYYDLVVRAFSSSSYGVTTVKRCHFTPAEGAAKCAIGSAASNWTTIAFNVPFKGTWINYPASQVTSPGYEYQTARVNDAAGGNSDTMLLGLDSANNLAAFDDDSGVNLMSLISTDTGQPWRITKLVVGGYSGDGYTHVYTNDSPVRDGDGDGVGKWLEYYLQTCDTPAIGDSMSRSYCYGRNLALLADSDRDGLFDGEELFGIDDDTYPQDMPAWGADPLRKDIFIEQDWAIRPTCSGTATDCWNAAVTTNPFTEAMAANMASAFASASQWEAGNVVGGGIGLHIDIGKPCTNYHLCGSWGHGGQQKIWGSTPPNWKGLEYLPLVRQFDGFSWVDGSPPVGHAARFRYLMIFPTGGQTGIGDLVTVGIKGFAPPADHHARGVLHELGHSLGIQHWGHDEGNPAARANCKPNYRSLMNYAFNEFAWDFSHGDIPSVLDPGRVKEIAAYGASATHLLAGNTSCWWGSTAVSCSKFNFPEANAAGDVDFNRSTDLNAGTAGFIRAGVTHTTGGGCGAAANITNQVLTGASDTFAAVTPALAIYSGRQWVFWASGAQIKYRSDAHSGANTAGSCAGGSGTLGEGNCQDFLSKTIRTVPLTTSTTVLGLSVLEWNGSLVLAYTTSDNQLWIRSTNSISLDDLGWAPAPATPVASNLMFDTEVELSPMFVDDATHSSKFSQPRVLAAFVVESGTPFGRHVWYYANSPSGTWSGPEYVTQYGYPGWAIPARRVAAVTTWPNAIGGAAPPETVGSACAVFPSARSPATPPNPSDLRDDMYFGCYNKVADSWDMEHNPSTGAVSPLPGGRAMSGRRPSIAFHTFREAGQGSVTPLKNATTGQFWITATINPELAAPSAKSLSVLWVSREVSAALPPNPMYQSTGLVAADEVWDDWTHAQKNTGVVIRETGDVSALKGVIQHYAQPQRDGPMFDWISFLPFVDGTWHGSLKDINDYRIMDRGICLGLRGKSMSDEGLNACGFKNSSGY